MKHTWTEAEALNYVARCERGIIKKGLKFCSAKDFLKNHTSTVVSETIPNATLIEEPIEAE